MQHGREIAVDDEEGLLELQARARALQGGAPGSRRPLRPPPAPPPQEQFARGDARPAARVTRVSRRPTGGAATTGGAQPPAPPVDSISAAVVDSQRTRGV